MFLKISLWPIFAVIVAYTGVEQAVKGFVASTYDAVFFQSQDAIFGARRHQYAVAADAVGYVALIYFYGCDDKPSCEKDQSQDNCRRPFPAVHSNVFASHDQSRRTDCKCCQQQHKMKQCVRRSSQFTLKHIPPHILLF